MADSEEYEYDYDDYDDEEDYPVDDDEDDDDIEYDDEEDDENGGKSEMDWMPSSTDDNPNAAPMGKAPVGIRMLPSEDLVPEMKRRLKETTEVLDVPPSAAAVLLRHFSWSKEVLLEKFYNDPDALQKKYGVWNRCNRRSSNGQAPTVCPVATSAFHNKPTTRASAKAAAAAAKAVVAAAAASPKSSPTTCDICYEDDVRMLGMPCGHEFCVDCWKEFLANAIQEEGPQCVSKTCPQAKCPEIVTEEEVEQIVKHHTANMDDTLLVKFQRYQLRSFVDSNKLTRWCPGRGCERIACASSASAMEQAGAVAHCDACSTSFCVVCGEDPHAPCSCKELARWLEKCRNESETANWILANTKPCPKCSSRIEKNQGCNHMTCQRCKFEFCWICMGDWSEHGANTGGYYKCNKFDPNDDGSDQSDAARAKRELDRYLHYYKRYHAHSEAQAFARKQLKETEARMILLQESSENARWADVEFLKTANEQLVECRRVLKYTYVFAYYFPPERQSQKERFEYHQEMLERFTENLSELSEKPLAEMDRTDVVNQTRVVDRFMKNILKYAEDGMDD